MAFSMFDPGDLGLPGLDKILSQVRFDDHRDEDHLYVFTGITDAGGSSFLIADEVAELLHFVQEEVAALASRSILMAQWDVLRLNQAKLTEDQALAFGSDELAHRVRKHLGRIGKDLVAAGSDYHNAQMRGGTAFYEGELTPYEFYRRTLAYITPGSSDGLFDGDLPVATHVLTNHALVSMQYAHAPIMYCVIDRTEDLFDLCLRIGEAVLAASTHGDRLRRESQAESRNFASRALDRVARFLS